MEKQLKILIGICTAALVILLLFTLYTTIRGGFILAMIGIVCMLICVAILVVLSKNLRIARTMGANFLPYDSHLPAEEEEEEENR